MKNIIKKFAEYAQHILYEAEDFAIKIEEKTKEHIETQRQHILQTIAMIRLTLNKIENLLTDASKE